MSPHHAIGCGGKLPWHLPEDLARFRELTWGHTVIMGRKTFVSLPHGALPGRRNIVVSRTVCQLPGCEVYASPEEALQHCDALEEVFVIGGASLYRWALTLADRLYITLVSAEPRAADTFFPSFESDGWHETERDRRQGFAFTLWLRKDENRYQPPHSVF